MDKCSSVPPGNWFILKCWIVFLHLQKQTLSEKQICLTGFKLYVVFNSCLIAFKQNAVPFQIESLVQSWH